VSRLDAQGIGLILGPQATGIALDTPPSPERQIADLEERLRQAGLERDMVNAKLANALESAKVRGEALERTEAEVERLRGVVGELVDKLAENSQRPHHPWLEIAAMPTVYDDGNKCHESVMRSFHVVKEVRWLLAQGVPPAVVMQIMDLLEGVERADRRGL